MRCFGAIFLLFCLTAYADERVLHEGMAHLRGGGERPEWSRFADREPSGDSLEVRFAHEEAQAGETTLWFRQRNLQWAWDLELNGRRLARLEQDEQPRLVAVAVPPGTLRAGENRLRFAHRNSPRPDDVWIGDVRLDPRPRSEVLGAARLRVRVRDADLGGPVPCRITVVDPAGDLVPFGNRSDDRVVVRTGVLYTLDGEAELHLPARPVTVYASRGFEYSVASNRVELVPGRQSIDLSIRREVDTRGFVAMDTHVHTVTHSRHGDCTLTERMATLAGEGVEVAVATDHNLHVDYTAERKRLGIDAFTSVTGNEYTTRTGHFNLFPCDPAVPPPAYVGPLWSGVSDGIRRSRARIAILNHPRDTQTNYRPFDPLHHDPLLGEARDGRDYGVFNAMEVWNSGATQCDPLQLLNDWLALVQRGWRGAPIACSDSHDVSRYLVGQGRTYVRVPDTAPGRIDVEALCREVEAGRTWPCAGLFVHLSDHSTEAEFVFRAEVRHPTWIRARHLQIRAGERFEPAGGLQPELRFPRKDRPHDFMVMAVATGDDPEAPFWPIAYPYKPDHSGYRPTVFGASAPRRVDADGDGMWTSPGEYARFVLALPEPAFLASLDNPADSIPPEAEPFLYLSERAQTATSPAARRKRAEWEARAEAAGRENRFEDWGN